MILSFRTDRPGQTEKQPDQGLHYLQFRLHLLDALLFGKAILQNFRLSEILGYLRYFCRNDQEDTNP